MIRKFVTYLILLLLYPGCELRTRQVPIVPGDNPHALKDFTVADCYLDTENEKDKCDYNIYVSSWYLGRCRTRPYGGCNPTTNNFETEVECNMTAKPVCEQITGGLVDTVSTLTGLLASTVKEEVQAATETVTGLVSNMIGWIF